MSDSLHKILSLVVPGALFFPDGSSVEYLARNDTLRYSSPGHGTIQVTLLYDATTKISRVEWPKTPQWDGALHHQLTDPEWADLKSKIAAFVAKKPKRFAI